MAFLCLLEIANFIVLYRKVPVDRRNPAKLINILNSPIGEYLHCDCPYCKGKKLEELMNDPLAKKHFLLQRHMEIDILRSFDDIKGRVDYIENKIRRAIEYHKALRPYFKQDDYRHLKIWLTTIGELKKVYNIE